MKAILGKNLPEIVEATLLSSKELKECREAIKAVEEDDGEYYYLRTPYDDDMIGIARLWREEEPADPDYEDFPPEGSAGTMLRPILRLANSELKDGTVLEVGDRVVVGNSTFTAISDTILFSDREAWFDKESNTYGYFDDDTNEYEDSLAKMRVDEWFENKIKPRL